MKARKSCWTCTARKTQCDGGLPTCKKCCRGQRLCQGYEMRLSWPRDNDKRRAIVGDHASGVMAFPSEVSTDLFFINTTSPDVELYNHLSLRRKSYHISGSISPDLLAQPQPRVKHMDLVRHFYDSAHLSLATFCVTTSQIRDALMSMALAQDTVPGLALFYAMLAFSSLHRHGVNEQTVKLKILAIHFLSASMEDESLILTNAAQHVAASMLLASFETLLPLESSGDWLYHIWGAMDMIQATSLKDESYGGDTGRLLDWVYYHDTLSRFAVRHWHHDSSGTNMKPSRMIELDSRKVQYPPLSRHRPVPPSPNPMYAIVNLMSEICNMLLDPRDPRSGSPEYQDSLIALETRIDDVSIESDTAISTPEAAFAVELYRMATRVYLARASQNPWEEPTKLDSWIDAVFDGPMKTCSCEHFFPLLILACEARRDEHRVAILNLIDRTQRDARIRSVQGVKDAIQSIWVQQDLHADSDLLVNYFGIMSTVISSSTAVPSFA